MKFIKSLSTGLGYLLAFMGVFALKNAFSVDSAYIITSLFFLIPAILFLWLPNKTLDLTPFGFFFTIRGLISLYVYFTAPITIILIEAVVFLVVGILMFLIPTKTRKRNVA